MRIKGARIIVTGATGVLGGELATALHGEGARLGLMGRDQGRLDEVAERLPGSAVARFEAMDLEDARSRVRALAGELGGLDALVVAHGVASFGPVEDEDDAVAEHLYLVNALAPMALIRAALGEFTDGGNVVAVSAVVADYPTAQMAAYSASKAALTAWLTALRAERRRGDVTVLDVRAPHMDTGLVNRPLAGEAPRVLPKPFDRAEVVAAVVQGLAEDSRVISYDPRERELRRS